MDYCDGFRCDDVCMLVGLAQNSELNGRAVTVCLPDGPLESGRVPCQLFDSNKKFAAKSTNLFKIEDEWALTDTRVHTLMPRDDWIEAARLIHAKRECVADVAGVVLGRSESPPMRRHRASRSTPPPPPPPTAPSMDSDAPLTNEEKVEAIRIGQWGDRTSSYDWGRFVHQVKTARGGDGCYPNDWHPMIIQGSLFHRSSSPLRVCRFDNDW